jgi:hypothetical protein
VPPAAHAAAAAQAAPCAPHAAAAGGASCAPEAEAEEGQVFRVRTLAVPVSIPNTAPSADRLQTLLRLSEAEGGAPLSLAFVDADGTVIVSHIHPGLVAPEVLQGPEEEEEAEKAADRAAFLAAAILPDEGEDAAMPDAGAAGGSAPVSCDDMRAALRGGGGQ